MPSHRRRAASRLVALAFLLAMLSPRLAPAAEPAATSNANGNDAYAGSPTCRPCHEAQFSAWKGSDHERSMQPATAATVLGNFAGASFEHGGVRSTFRTEGGKFVVNTDGPDGALHDYEVKFTFGVRPLQQYLVEFPGGRLQPLATAWDSRPASEGGQRWFHLYPNEKLTPGDPLHWTGLYQNWNLQCASCHSTNLRKNYDQASRTYATTYAEIDVACETCHGPGKAHAEWAAAARPPYAPDDRKGLDVLLRRRPEEAWRFPALDARFAVQDPAVAADRSAARARMNTCAPCHARRSALTEHVVPGAPLEDSQRPALLTDPLYFADGQQHDEVFTWGSFVQSKMFARGVTCDDCHDPHSVARTDAGNGLCAKCHNPAVFDQKSHHFHEIGGKGSACVDCHMPPRNYMVVDARRDHSLRVPRPDVAARVGAPDACTGCHAKSTTTASAAAAKAAASVAAGTTAAWADDATAAWAADTMDRWYGPAWRQRPEYGSALHRAATDGAKSLDPLLALAADASQPAIVRATATDLARAVVRPEALDKARALLADPDPMVRAAAASLLEPFDAATRASALAPLLGDPVRVVRVEAARQLADVPDSSLSTPQQAARAIARREYLDSLERDADWPASLSNLGNFQQREGHGDDAVASYRRAIDLDPRFVGAWVNLADTLRAQGKNAEAEDVLRRGLERLPDAAGLHHAWGLALVRKGDKAAALDQLAKAAALAPDNTRFAYVYAVALKSAGNTDEALAVLDAANRRHPYDVDVLATLVSMHLEAGHPEAVLPYARSLAEVLPDDAGLQALIARLQPPN